MLLKGLQQQLGSGGLGGEEVFALMRVTVQRKQPHTLFRFGGRTDLRQVLQRCEE